MSPHLAFDAKRLHFGTRMTSVLPIQRQALQDGNESTARWCKR